MDVIYYVAASLDGYIATPDGGVEWLKPFENSGEDYGYAEFYTSVDALLMGSATFEKTLSFGDWPYGGKPCRVFSTRALTVPSPDVVMTSVSPKEALNTLSRTGCRRVWLVGGGALAALFRQQGLISEYIVSVIPVILGGGITLFATGGRPDSLNLLESKTYSTGVVQLRYAPVSLSFPQRDPGDGR